MLFGWLVQKSSTDFQVQNWSWRSPPSLEKLTFPPHFVLTPPCPMGGSQWLGSLPPTKPHLEGLNRKLRQAPCSQILQLSSEYQEQSLLRLWEFFLLSVYPLPHRYSSKFVAKIQGVQKKLEKNQSSGTLGIESPVPAGMYAGE